MGIAMPRRAWVLLKSGRRLNLLQPMATDWEDEDLALGLSRTYRWGGHSAWELPLSVAQHSLTVLALRQDIETKPLSGAEAPIKSHLGGGFHCLVSALKEAIVRRYRLPPWSAEAYAAHKHADRLAAASEAFHVVGWSIAEIRGSLEIELDPVRTDPVRPPPGMRPWEPWPPSLACSLFLAKLKELMEGDLSGQP
jgi:hypothetical protein